MSRNRVLQAFSLYRHSLSRKYSVVSWGLNHAGQCGDPSLAPLLEGPREIESLRSPHAITTLAAGHSHSAAVTATGEAFLFGDGSEGRLGNSRTDPVYRPERCEALVHSPHGIVDVALGRSHTLFLDASGAVHACGVASDTLSAEAAMHQQHAGYPLGEGAQKGSTFQGRSLGPSGPGAFAGAAGHGHGSAAARYAAAVAREQQEQRAAQAVGWHSMQLVPFVDHSTAKHELERSQMLINDEVRSLASIDSAKTRWEEAGGPASAPVTLDLVATPIRLKRAEMDVTPMALARADVSPRTNSTQNSGVPNDETIGVASCGMSGGSVVLSSSGIPLTLRPPRSSLPWHDRAAFRLRFEAPCPLLETVVADLGGATQVAAGAGFFAALTAAGKAIVWLDIGVSTATGKKLECEAVELKDGVTLRALGDTFLAVLTGLPPLTSIAAGRHRLHVSDGSSVWSIDVVTGKQSKNGEDASSIEPSKARRVLRLDDEGVDRLAAGGRAVAAISGAGRLWLWGSVLSQEAAAATRAVAEGEGHGHWAYSRDVGRMHGGNPAGEKPGARWEGLGSEEPVVVPGLHNVKNVAFGGAHALAEIG